MRRAQSLKGHTDEVLCVEARPDDGIIASGGADSTVRIWDMRASRRAVACLCRCFQDEAVCSLAWGRNALLHAAANTLVVSFDLRRLGLIVTEANASYPAVSDDEVNQICVNPNLDELACASDTGSVHRVHLGLPPGDGCGRLAPPLFHGSICSCAQYNPQNGDQLVSGSMDCSLAFWNNATNERVKRIEMNSELQGAGESPQQMWNPPMVHGISFSPHGDCLLVALGNGCVAALSVELPEEGGIVVSQKLCHSAAVTQVRHICFDSEMVASVGNDCFLRLWDECQWMDSQEEAFQHLDEYRLNNKPNWMCSSSSPGGQEHILVADTGKDLTVVQVLRSANN
jgi:WD40 repeat protein